VEVCFTSPDGSAQVRVSGTAQVVEDLDLKKRMVEEREFLKPIVFETGYDKFKIIKVTGCRATTWNFETNLLPKEHIDLT